MASQSLVNGLMTCLVAAYLILLCMFPSTARAADSEDKTIRPPPVITSAEALNMPSIVFTYWEHIEVKRARSGIGSAPQRNTADRQASAPIVTAVKPPAEARFINMQALIYNGPEDWVVHINNKRITPAAFPEEILEMNVTEDYVEMRWYDAYLRQIIPIRMRPNQRFNIDSLMFVSGYGATPSHLGEEKK